MRLLLYCFLNLWSVLNLRRYYRDRKIKKRATKLVIKLKNK